MKTYSKEQQESYYQQWQSSGMSNTQFAKDHELKPTTFYYWIQKFEKLSIQSSKESVTEGFVAINPLDVPIATDLPTAIIHYPSGVSFELFKTSDKGFLKTLLEYSCCP